MLVVSISTRPRNSGSPTQPKKLTCVESFDHLRYELQSYLYFVFCYQFDFSVLVYLSFALVFIVFMVSPFFDRFLTDFQTDLR